MSLWERDEDPRNLEDRPRFNRRTSRSKQHSTPMPLHILSAVTGAIPLTQNLVPIFVGVVGAISVRVWAQGRANDRERDMHGRVVLMTVSILYTDNALPNRSTICVTGSFYSYRSKPFNRSCPTRCTNYRPYAFVVGPACSGGHPRHTRNNEERANICGRM